MPTVFSVVIPTKNRPQLLQRAVRSALSDLPADAELVIVDDGSNPHVSSSVLEAHDSRLRILKNTGRSGVSGARNFGVGHSKGDVIVFLDDDDEILPGYMAGISDAIAELAPDFGFSSRVIADDKAQERIKQRKLAEGLISQQTRFADWTTGLCGLWVKADVFRSVGGLDEELTVNEDTDFCLKLAEADAVGHYADDPGIRIHVARHSDGALDHVTKRSVSAVRAQAFGRIQRNHESYLMSDHSAFWFVQARRLKHGARATGWKANWRKAVIGVPAPFVLPGLAIVFACALQKRTS